MKQSSSSAKPLVGTGLLAALAASLCCITPLLAVVGGLGGVASSFSWLEPFRPYFILLSVSVLGFAWYRQLKPRPADECCAVGGKPSRLQSKGFLGVVTVLAALLVTIPYYGARPYPAPSGPGPVAATRDAAPVWQTANFCIGGMTCEACAKHVEHAVQQLPGVQAVTVSYNQGTAQVRFDAAKSPVGRVAQAINGTGYRVLPAGTPRY